MSARATESTVFSVFTHTLGMLADASAACNRAINNIDSGTMHFGHLTDGLMNQLRGVVNNISDPADWGNGFTNNINVKAVAELNQADWDAEVSTALTAIKDVVQMASDLFPRDAQGRVVYEMIDPGGSSYDNPGDLTALRAALVDALDKIG